MSVVSVIDGVANKIVDEIYVDFDIRGLSLNPATNIVYITGGYSNSSLGSISAIDGKSNKVVKNIDLDEYGSGIAVNPQTNMVYVSGISTIYGINGTTYDLHDVYDDYPTTSSSQSYQISGILVNPRTNMLYVHGINTESDFSSYATVFVIHGETNGSQEKISEIKLTQALSSEFTDLNPETNMIYVLSFISKTVSVLSHSDPESTLTLVK
jgi:DNA-binding beta-propeller fold protein YncE